MVEAYSSAVAQICRVAAGLSVLRPGVMAIRRVERYRDLAGWYEESVSESDWRGLLGRLSPAC